ncbi:TIGR02285 family protein [Burkholderiaceae bacterium UC74_6]
MKKRLAPLYLALGLLAPGWTMAAEAPVQVGSITWLTGEPVNLDNDKAISFSRQLVELIRREWPEVQHAMVQANARRAWQMIADREHACQLSSVHTAERDRVAYFRDFLIGPPQQIIVRRDKVAVLPRTASGDVDLPKLLASNTLRGALVDGRSYGEALDRIIAAAPRKPLVVRYSAGDYGSRIHTMLSRDRADYTIGYDATMRQEPGQAALLLTSESIGGANAPVLAGVACPRTPWGKAVIRRVDQIAVTPEAVALLRHEAESWLTPELRKRYAAQIEEFYRAKMKAAAAATAR